MIKPTGIIVLPGLLFVALGQGTSPPDVPESLKAPAGEEVILQAHASGAQIYTCQAAGDQKPAWVLKAPEADLFDARGGTIGRHYAGPTWKHNDGSEVTAKMIARHDAPDEIDPLAAPQSYRTFGERNPKPRDNHSTNPHQGRAASGSNEL